MQNLPLVSVIIPTYNNYAVVCQAIDCALNQTYDNLEVIVVNDGSTDGTEQLLVNKYRDRIIYIRQENKGAGGARNTGIRYASGKYLQFLDADDLLDLDKITIQMMQLQNHSTAISYCNYSCCDMDDSSITYRHKSPVLQEVNPFEDMMLKWETELSIAMHCFIFDAYFFKECGIAFDETLPANEDWECWMNLFALKPNLLYVDRELAYYRIRNGSRCSDRLKMRNSYLMAIDMQIHKNRANKDVVTQLKSRRKQIRNFYRDVAPLMKFLDSFHPIVRKKYIEMVPWRIQRIFF